MSENLPNVIYDLVNGEFENVQTLQESCNNLLDSITYVNEDIKLDFDPN